MRRPVEVFIQFDWSLLLAATTLSVMGLLAIYSIGISRETADLFQFQKQIVACLVGWALVFVAAFLDVRQLRSYAMPLYGVGALLLLGVLLFGTTIRGTRGWFVLGHLSFQPVEIAKVFLAIFLAYYMSRHAHHRIGWIPFAGSAFATALYVGLVLLQPDFGSAVVMMVMWFTTAIFAGLPRRAWLILFATVAVAGTALWTIGLKPYQRARLESFINPAADPLGAGYNVTQARIAIGSGGLFGKGLGEGSQSRLRFLPEASTDFVFSVLGEELGLVGIAITLGLFALLFHRMIRISAAAMDPFPQLLLIALLSTLAFHVLVNAGMNLGIMPVTGIPLPFVSAAPSSILAAFLAIAVTQSIAVQRQPAAFR